MNFASMAGRPGSMVCWGQLGTPLILNASGTWSDRFIHDILCFIRGPKSSTRRFPSDPCLPLYSSAVHMNGACMMLQHMMFVEVIPAIKRSVRMNLRTSWRRCARHQARQDMCPAVEFCDIQSCLVGRTLAVFSTALCTYVWQKNTVAIAVRLEMEHFLVG